MTMVRISLYISIGNIEKVTYIPMKLLRVLFTDITHAKGKFNVVPILSKLSSYSFKLSNETGVYKTVFLLNFGKLDN